MNQAIVKSTRYEGVNFHGRFESLLRIQSGKSPSFVLLIRQRTTREERRCLSVSKSGGKIGFERGIFISERRLNSQEFARLRPSAGFSLVTGHFPFFRILALIVDDIRCETLRFELSIQFPLSLSLECVVSFSFSVLVCLVLGRRIYIRFLVRFLGEKREFNKGARVTRRRSTIIRSRRFQRRRQKPLEAQLGLQIASRRL